MMEDVRLEFSDAIFRKQPDVIKIIQENVDPKFPGPGTEHIRLLYRSGDLMVGSEQSGIMATLRGLNKYKAKTEAESEEDEYEEETHEEVEEPDVDYPEVITEVLQSVREQDEAVKEIGRIIFHNQRVLKCERRFGVHPKKQNAFIVGPTGTGKTMSVTRICESLGLPYVIVDSTDLTQAGYKGKDIDDIFQELITVAGGDIEAAESGIVILDEFDKKESRDDGVGQDVSGKCVLDSLLKAVESKQILLRSGDVFDTTGVTFFALGVYPKLNQIRSERLKGKKSMGFGGEDASKKLPKEQQSTKYLWSDLERHGVTKELCGRFPCIIEFNDFSHEGYRNILLNSDNSEWKCQKELFEVFYDVKLEISEEGIAHVVDKAKSFGIGARGLNAAVTSMLAGVELDVLSGRMKHRRAVFGSEGKVEYCD